MAENKNLDYISTERNSKGYSSSGLSIYSYNLAEKEQAVQPQSYKKKNSSIQRWAPPVIAVNKLELKEEVVKNSMGQFRFFKPVECKPDFPEKSKITEILQKEERFKSNFATTLYEEKFLPETPFNQNKPIQLKQEEVVIQQVLSAENLHHSDMSLV